MLKNQSIFFYLMTKPLLNGYSITLACCAITDFKNIEIKGKTCIKGTVGFF